MIIFKDENEPLLESEAGAGTGPGTGPGHVNPVPQPGHVSPGHGTGTLFESEVETPASEVDKIRKRKIRESFGIWNKVTLLIFCLYCIHNRPGWPPKTSFASLDDQLPSMSGVHVLKDFLCSAPLHGSFDGRIYSLKHFHKCKFFHKRTQKVTAEKILNSWQWWELIVVCCKKCSGALSHSTKNQEFKWQ